MKLDKETTGMVLGALIGSLIEEVAEQVFPGVGEMGVLGESLGLLGGSAVTRESVATKQAVAQLLKFTYNQLGGDDDIEDLDQKSLEDFFRSKPQRTN